MTEPVKTKNKPRVYMPQELDAIIASIVRAINNDARHLLPPAYTFLCSCEGWETHGSWGNFVDYYMEHSLKDDLADNFALNLNDKSEEHYDWKVYEQREIIYRSILNAIGV